MAAISSAGAMLDCLVSNGDGFTMRLSAP
jgi:hypothetical protein